MEYSTLQSLTMPSAVHLTGCEPTRSHLFGLSVRASRQFSNHLKPDSFSLSSDSHIHFPLIPLTVIMWFLYLVYIIALHVSQKFPSIEYDDENYRFWFPHRESDSSETNSGLAHQFPSLIRNSTWWEAVFSKSKDSGEKFLSSSGT